MSYLKQISDIVEKHRREVVITCAEDCWCWGVEASICGHAEPQVDQGPSVETDSPTPCEKCGMQYEPEWLF